MNLNIASLLWATAAASDKACAVVEREVATDYATLRSRAGGLAGRLASAGVRPGDRVAVCLPRGAAAAAAYFGSLAAGGVALLLNDRLRPRQIEYALEQSGAEVLVTSAEAPACQAPRVRRRARVIEVDESGDEDFEPLHRGYDDVAQIIYTSGSTGMPKGVVFTHGQLRAGVDVVASYLGITADDRIASLLPFSSVYGLNQLLCAVARGAALVVEHSPVPQQIARELRARHVSVLAAVPPLWLQLLAAPLFRDDPIPTLRILQSAGGHLPVNAVRRLRAAQPQASLFLQYGMTETFRSTFLSPGEVDAHPDSMGRAIPGGEIFVVRDDGGLCEADEIGELVFRGPTVAAGYWNDPEATARVFRPDPFRRPGSSDDSRVVYSGDLVRRAADGLLYFVSRRDRLIKSLGFRVGPDEVLDVLYASGDVAEGIVTGEPDPDRGERIVAHVVLTAGGSREHLERFARTELPRHMQPSQIEVCTEIPCLGAGKYDVGALRAATSDSGVADIPPRS